MMRRVAVTVLAAGSLALAWRAQAQDMRPAVDRPEIMEVGDPILSTRKTLGLEMRRNVDLRDWVNLYGAPEYAEVQAFSHHPDAPAVCDPIKDCDTVAPDGSWSRGAHVPGSRLSTMLRRDIQKALDGGVMVLVVPTVDSVQEAQDIIDMAYYPPIGHRIYGPSQAQTIYANVPGGYRQTFNDNLVLVLMIETVLGSQAAPDIGALAHIDGLFGATSDLGNFSGYASGMVDYERLIKNTYDAAHSHGEGACTAFGFRGRVASANFPPPYGGFAYSFNCYQN